MKKTDAETGKENEVEVVDADTGELEEVAKPAEIQLLKTEDAAELILQNKRSVEFQDCNDRISRAIRDAVGNFLEIGEYLVKIEKEKLYEIGSFADIYEYAEKVFGLKKTSVANYVSVFLTFGKAEIAEKFNYTQLVELVPVASDPEVIKTFKPSMSVKEIRARKFINKLSEGEKQVEFLLMEAFPAVFKNWNEKSGDRNKRLFMTDYVPQKKGQYGSIERSSMTVSIGLSRIKIIRNSADYDTLFNVECSNPWVYKYISTVAQLTAFIESKDFKDWYEKAMALVTEKDKEKAKAAEIKAEAASKGASAVKQTLKNEKARSQYVRDPAHWKLTNSAEILPGVKMSVYTFDVKPEYIEIRINERKVEYRQIMKEHNAMYSSCEGDIIRWLLENKI